MLKLASVIIYGAEFVGEIISVQFTILIFTLPEEEEDDQVISALFITHGLCSGILRVPLYRSDDVSSGPVRWPQHSR